MQPLVSILIPAYNSEHWIAQTLQSAIDQTWPRKEIIVVDDGSTDRTRKIAEQFIAQGVKVVSVPNEGASAARNRAFQLSQGDYIQWLDADDLVAPNKVESQLKALEHSDSGRLLLSGPWAFFSYRPERAGFTPTALWHDLAPAEWLFRKMNENLHMQTATWLTSRKLAEAAGPWDTRLISDDDGEYFCRVLRASEGTRFVPEAKVFYRATSMNRRSFVGTSDAKLNALLLSMKLHVQYLRTLEESERVRKACLTYLQNWLFYFYPERVDLVAELQSIAAELGGQLDPPRLRWKYAFIRPLVGWKAAKRAQLVLPNLKGSAFMLWDKAIDRFERTQGSKP